MNQPLVYPGSHLPAEVLPRTAKDVREQVNLIQSVMKEVMQKDQHYGLVPGCGEKPTLLKPGAEKLCLTFRLAPSYFISREMEGEHLTITSTCTLTHIPTTAVWGTGMGSCSTRETKYAYRKATRACPLCGKESIIKGKAEYGGGWLCYGKKGGCGGKFPDGDVTIESQIVGRVPNEDVADQYTTVLKIANKRSLVAAVLNVTAASDIFTQDIEDDILNGEVLAQPPLAPAPSAAVESVKAVFTDAAPVAPSPSPTPATTGLATKVNAALKEIDQNQAFAREELWSALLTMHNRNDDLARTALAELSTFQGTNGVVLGVRDVWQLKAKRLWVMHDKVMKLFAAWQTEHPDYIPPTAENEVPIE